MRYFIRITDGGHFTEENTFEITEKFHLELVKTVEDQIKRGKARRV